MMNNKTNGPIHIFVYGSLRPEFEGGRVCNNYLSGCRDLGLATIPGKLYRISWFPGVRHYGGPVDETNEYPRVMGHVFEIPAEIGMARILNLDGFEGYNVANPERSLFTRGITRATLENGSTMLVTVYYYNHDTNEVDRIESGDFIGGDNAES
jgi:gamma-glutamylcyclotransferase (GGCT)/AIG2-like uncharacterized protein YtfP